MKYPNTIRQVPHNIYSAILCIALFPYYGDSSGAILEVPSEALLHLSVVSRSSVGGIRQGIREGKETAILRKSLSSEFNLIARYTCSRSLTSFQSKEESRTFVIVLCSRLIFTA